MAFVNEGMTNEERVEFAAKSIKNPGNILSTLKPTRWTIDREENVSLIWGLRQRETDDYYFLLCWKGIPIPVKLREYWVNGSPRTWELIYIKISADLEEKRMEIIQSLKDALTVFGFDGDPDWPNNETTKVQFNF